MTGLEIYTTDYDPRRVYGDGTGGDSGPVERAIRFGDAPLALLVEFDGRDARAVWSFKCKRGSTSRTEYYVADYRADRSDAFRSLAAELATAHDDGWIVPHAGDLRWDLGFDLWRVPADVPGLSRQDREELFEGLGGDGPSEPVVFGMSGYRSALATVRAIQEAGIECTVAVGTDGDPSTLDGVDLLLLPDGGADFEPKRSGSDRLDDSSNADGSEPDACNSPEATNRTGTDEGNRPETDPGSPRPSPAGPGGSDVGLGTRIAGAGLLVVLAFAGYSFVSQTPVHPITGLSTIGGAVGALAAFLVYAYRMRSPEGPEGTGEARFRERLVADQEWTLAVVAYGTFSAFLFPTVFRVGGRYVTEGYWLFGSIDSLGYASLQVPLFVAGLYALSVNLLSVVHRRYGQRELPTATLRDLAVAHLLYGIPVLLATGLAQALWYRVMPAITP